MYSSNSETPSFKGIGVDPPEGCKEGSPELDGSDDGSRDGIPDNEADGLSDGCTDGILDSPGLGIIKVDGVSEPGPEGLRDGSNPDEIMEGSIEGACEVAARVGSDDGFLDRKFVGACEAGRVFKSALDGAKDGNMDVGEADGHGDGATVGS